MIRKVLVAGLVGACGCSGNAESPLPTSIGTEIEALSFHEHCDTAPADLVHDFTREDITPTRTYGSSQCANAYLIDLHMPASPRFFPFIEWEDVMPTTEEECSRSSRWWYAWELTDSGPVALDAFAKVNTWDGDSCESETDHIHDKFIDLVPGKSYRYAIAGRLFAADGVHYSRRKIGLSIERQ